MKKTVRQFIYALIIISTVLAMVGCAQATQAPVAAPTSAQATTAHTQPAQNPAANVKLTFWVNGRDSYIGPSEQQLPQDQWYISQAIKRFEAANPGVTIELVVQADALQAHQTFKTAGVAGNAPDIANLWSGQFSFNDKDVITPIQDKIPQADKDGLVGWETVTEGFGTTPGGNILGYPTPDNQMCIFIYNKKIVKDAGLDFEANPP
jgi:raffinose/stachyose/melibiose transport system substrate-binding protein